MKAFVTGGAGFIGSHLIDRLIAGGNQVTVYDNFSSGKMEFIDCHMNSDGFKLVRADLLELRDLGNILPGHDIVFHLAANPDVRWGLSDTALDLQQQTIATRNVLEVMRQGGVYKMVFASSSTVYGETPVKPLSENYGPLLPASLYGASKLACEGLISAFCHCYNMQAWLFRFGNVVGSRATHGVIFDFIKKLNQNPGELEILGDGEQSKPYLHVDDCVDGILFGLKNANGRVNLFNLGCSSTTKVKTIAETLVAAMGMSGVKFRYTGGSRGWPGDVPQVRFNVDKMSRLGWMAKYTSDEAVRRAIDDILASGVE